MSAHALSRRTALKALAGSAGMVVLAGCGATPTATPVPAPKATAAPVAQPTTAPVAQPTTAPAAKATTAPVAQPTTPPAQAATKQTTINFLARGDESTFKVYRQIKDNFEKENPSIKVVLDETPSEWFQKFQVLFASGTAPDATFNTTSTVGATARKKMVLALDDLLAKEPNYKKENFYAAAFPCSAYEHVLYALPYDGGPYVLYWDKDLFKAAGLEPLSPTKRATWNEILEMAKKLTMDMDGRHPGEAGFDPKRIKQYGIEPRADLWSIYVYCWGGEVLDDKGNLVVDSPETIEALQWLADLGTKHYVAPSPGFQQSNPVNFLSSNMAMQMTGAFDVVRQRQRKNDWDIAPMPQTKGLVTCALYSGFSIVSSTKNPDAAWKWLWYNCSEPGQTVVAGLGQTVPAIKSVAQKMVADTTTRPEHKSVFLGEFDNVRFPGDKMGTFYAGYGNEWEQVWDPIFDGVWRGSKTPAAALKEVTPKLNTLLKTGQVT